MLPSRIAPPRRVRGPVWACPHIAADTHGRPHRGRGELAAVACHTAQRPPRPGGLFLCGIAQVRARHRSGVSPNNDVLRVLCIS